MGKRLKPEEIIANLDFEPARFCAYSPANVMIERFQAVLALGLVNGRMKDLYDLWAIPKSTTIEPGDLSVVIKATLERRRTLVHTEEKDQRPKFASDGY